MLGIHVATAQRIAVNSITRTAALNGININGNTCLAENFCRTEIQSEKDSKLMNGKVDQRKEFEEN
jgi:hypothetical protein